LVSNASREPFTCVRPITPSFQGDGMDLFEDTVTSDPPPKRGILPVEHAVGNKVLADEKDPDVLARVVSVAVFRLDLPGLVQVSELIQTLTGERPRNAGRPDLGGLR
jgi:hypothetical protein